MKNNFKFHTALLLCLMGLQGVNAQTTSADFERTKQILTYGNWDDLGKEYGVDTQNLPTQVKDCFYNNKGKLIKTLEGNVQLGDNPATIMKIERFGEVQPSKYTTYNYDNDDRLVSVVECAYQADNGWFFNWKEQNTLSEYTYNENGKLATKTDKDFKYNYTWNGEQVTVENKLDKATGKVVATTYYSNFVAENSNLAKKAVVVTEDAAYLIENEYDANLRLSKSVKYNLVNPKKDANGAIVDGEKGEPYNKKEVTFNEEKGGYLTTEYAYENGAWKALQNATLDVVGNYDFTIPVAEISIEPNEERANSVSITFANPGDLSSDVKWNVYRNGVLLGQANFFDNRWTFADLEAANGTYDYYVMADTISAPGYKAISNVVSQTHATELTNAGNIRAFESGKSQVKDEQGNAKSVYVYNLAWDVPETSNTIYGYNLYLNDAAQPVNKKLIRTPYYELVLDNANELKNKVAVEIVYAEGYMKSQPVEITLNADYEINQNRVSCVQKVVTFGNTMGSVTSTTVSKEDVNYYDANNRLMMTVSLSRMVGDDPDTPEVEKAGDIIPTQYIVYDYNDKNQLVSKRSREYGIFSGYDRAWNKDIKTEKKCTYNENGKLIESVEENKTFRYEWEGDNIITEASFSNRKMDPLAFITYSNFSEAGTNLPQYALSISKHPYMTSYNRVFEFDYDEKGRLIAKREFKHGSNIEKDANGVIIKADKGTPVEEQLWFYEGDFLRSYVKNKWKSSEQALCPYSKKVFTPTAKGLREENYTYSSMSTAMGWTKSTLITETVNNVYYGETAPGTLTASTVEGKVNGIRLTCDAPTKTYGENVTYDVYRNGSKVGEAKAEGNQLVFEESEVPNGVWHYIVKPSSAYESIDFLSTNWVETTFDTELPPVQNVNFPVNGVKDNGDFQLIVNWDAPETDLTIIGYNVYTDIKSYTKNPSPVNGVSALPENTRSYEFSWSPYTRTDKTICVEAVYNIGKIKSENYPVTLQSVPTGIVANETTSHMAVVGNDLMVNGNYQSLCIYAANGARMAQYSNVNTVNMNSLPNGVYVVKLVTAQGIETLKVLKK